MGGLGTWVVMQVSQGLSSSGLLEAPLQRLNPEEGIVARPKIGAEMKVPRGRCTTTLSKHPTHEDMHNPSGNGMRSLNSVGTDKGPAPYHDLSHLLLHKGDIRAKGTKKIV